MGFWVQVLINVPINQSFTYKNPFFETHAQLIGKRVEVQFGSRRLIANVIADLDKLPENLPIPESNIKPILRIVDEQAIFNEELIALSAWISSFYLCSHGEALGAMLPAGKRESETGGIAFDDEDFSAVQTQLSDEQKTAITHITNETETKPVYLFGATGTGKTEVFLQAAEYFLAQNKTVLYLVPEISLTHQVIDSVVMRFGTKAAILHSGLSGSKKLTEWMRIKRGEATIVVGARSAIFAPVQNLGLIIIDEEHDSSYKSGNTPRYHARQVAMHRCSLNKAKLVMGSATPSVEAYYQMKTELIATCILSKRLAGGSPPQIQIINLAGTEGALSKSLKQEISETKLASRQSILFLNRRGFSHFFRCNTCGYEQKCKNCSVPLTWHRQKKIMKCHYCGWQTQPPTICPECQSLDVGWAGFGTEFIETEVRTSFPDLSIQRIDTDSLTEKDSLKKKIEEFRKGKIDLLLGTQMVAKGLNFPGVRLVGIVLADTGLHLPDFRASERSFSLITQVAGRAGRFFPDGRVLVQTWSPSNPAIRFACENKIEEFYEWELAQRKELDFPPFTRLIRLVFRSKKDSVAQEGAIQAASMLKDILGVKGEILGPSECPISLIAGNTRWQILIKGKNLAPLISSTKYFLESYKLSQALYIEVDVDPLNLL